MHHIFESILPLEAGYDLYSAPSYEQENVLNLFGILFGHF